MINSNYTTLKTKPISIWQLTLVSSLLELLVSHTLRWNTLQDTTWKGEKF